MKTIVLVRHAKAKKKTHKLRDFERKLRKRGMKDSVIMAGVLKNLNVTPDKIISSPSARTLTTAKILAKELMLNEDQVISDPRLYLESKAKLFSAIQQLDDNINTVFLVGHNPDLTELANSLEADSVENIPTCGIAGYQFENENWAGIEIGKAKRLFTEVPKKNRKEAKKREKQIL